MRITLLLFIAILISIKATSEINKPEDKVQNEELDDLDLFMSFPSFKMPSIRPSMPSFKPSMPSFKPTTFKPSMPSFKPTTFKPSMPSFKPTTFKPSIPSLKPTTFKPTTIKPTTFKPTGMKPSVFKPTTFKPTTFKPTTSTAKSILNPRSNFQTNMKNKVNGFYKGLNKLPNSLPVVNPLNNRKDFNVGKKLKFGVENDFHNIKADGSYTRTKNLGPGMKRDTKYSGSIGAKFEDGRKGISGSIGKTTTDYRGPFYTQRGNQHSLSVDALHKNGNRGIEASYTNTKTNGRGIKIGKSNIANIHSNDRTYTLGGGVEKNGRKYGNIGYQNKYTNTHSIGYGDKKISRSDYTARAHQISGGYRKTRDGREIDGSYTRKDIKGQKYSVGKYSITRENEVGNKYNGRVKFGRNGGSVTGSLERYNKQTYKGKVGAIDASYSKKDYRNIQGGAYGSYKNGIFKGGLGGRYANGQTHTAKLGDAKFTAGRENSYSGKIGITSSRNGVGIRGQGQRSTRYNGGFSGGNVNVGGSFKQTQSVGGSAHFNRNSFGARGNYGQRYDVGGTGRFGKNRIGMKGHFSENTYGGIGGRFNRQGGSIHGNIGRSYSAGALVNVNGRKVGANGRINGQLNGNLGYNKRTGFTGQVGAKGQAHVGAQIGNVGAQANLRVNVGIGNKNGHLGLNGGIHGGIDIRTGKGKNIHIGKQTIKKGARFVERQVKNGVKNIGREVKNGVKSIGREVKNVGRQVNNFRNKIIRNVGPRTFGGIVRGRRFK